MAMLQVLGFVVLLAGTSIYNELIRTWLPDSMSRASSLDMQVAHNSSDALPAPAVDHPMCRAENRMVQPVDCQTSQWWLAIQNDPAPFPNLIGQMQCRAPLLAGSVSECIHFLHLPLSSHRKPMQECSWCVYPQHGTCWRSWHGSLQPVSGRVCAHVQEPLLSGASTPPPAVPPHPPPPSNPLAAAARPPLAGGSRPTQVASLCRGPACDRAHDPGWLLCAMHDRHAPHISNRCSLQFSPTHIAGHPDPRRAEYTRVHFVDEMAAPAGEVAHAAHADMTAAAWGCTHHRGQSRQWPF